MTKKNKILVYAGTQDGKEIACKLADNGIEIDVCVATSYGEEMFDAHELIHIRTGRMTAEEMQGLMRENSYAAVVDATHPFATEVSKNILAAAQALKLPCYRYSREIQAAEKEDDLYFVNTVDEAVEILNQLTGKILLTTGSKDLHTFAEKINDKERLIVRVLPSIESITLCEQAGIGHKQIIAMHGPFSEEMNVAMLTQYDADILVTKETGAIGGYPEKLKAAYQTHTQVVVIKNPELEKQYSMTELMKALSSLLQIDLCMQSAKELIIAGIGMGQEEGMTLAVRHAIQKADILFGAERLLQSIAEQRIPKIPLYQKDKIISYLNEHNEYQKPVVLMSGDIGFYSGSQAFQDMEQTGIKVTFLCGSSSLSYFCAKLGVSWHDCHITSMHGREVNLIGKLQRYPKVFSLFSDLTEIRTVLKKMCDYHMDQYQVHVGSNLSYKEEQIRNISPMEWDSLSDLPEKGLYVVLFEQQEKHDVILFPTISDEQFIRGKVPMTKAGIRDLSLARLKLHENATVWDIGAGTGSISVACALVSDTIQVYAIEQKEEAIDLIAQNKEHFCVDALKIIHAKAPEGLFDLPTPSHVFIGGSSGNLSKIMEAVWIKNKQARVVINAITLETITEALHILKQYAHTEEEIMQVSIAQASEIGAYHLMQAQNPVYIISFKLGD